MLVIHTRAYSPFDTPECTIPPPPLPIPLGWSGETDVDGSDKGDGDNSDSGSSGTKIDDSPDRAKNETPAVVADKTKIK